MAGICKVLKNDLIKSIHKVSRPGQHVVRSLPRRGVPREVERTSCIGLT